MSDDRTRRWLGALERARAQLEIALSADKDWRALGLATSRASRLAHERALSGNPVYQAWDLLGHALTEMHAGGPAGGGSEPAAPRRTKDHPAGSAQPAQAARRRIELRDVVEHIHRDAALGGRKPAAVDRDRDRTAPAATARPRPPSGIEDDGPFRPSGARPTAAVEEEATVSFVIREPERSGRADAAPVGPDLGEEQPPGEAAGPDAAADAEDAQDAEAQVVIVPRSR